jgi:hypothetical protein
MYQDFEEWYNLQLTKTEVALEETYQEIQKDYDRWKNFIIVEQLSMRRSKKHFYLRKMQSLKLKLNTLAILMWKSK